MNVLRRWLGWREAASVDIAKDRLRLVLVHNRLALSPERLEDLKRDMIGVLSRYFEIDQDSLEMDVRRGERANQLITTISVRQAS